MKYSKQIRCYLLTEFSGTLKTAWKSLKKVHSMENCFQFSLKVVNRWDVLPFYAQGTLIPQRVFTLFM